MPRVWPSRAPDVAQDYLQSFDIDPKKVSADDWGPQGYRLLVSGALSLSAHLDDREYEWRRWPEGFDYLKFVLMMTPAGNLTPLDAVIQAMTALNHRLVPFGYSIAFLIDSEVFDLRHVIRDVKLVPIPAVPATQAGGE